ncbi:MAG: FxsA family protein [Rhizobiaceae bacterium]
MPLTIIPFVLLLIPVLEIAVFILVGNVIGLMPTLLMILVTAVIGSLLLRIQGLSVLSALRGEMEAGRIPGRELGDAFMIFAAGILLLTPGFVTDTLGFLLFVPGVRGLIRRFILSRLGTAEVFVHRSASGGAARSGNTRVIDLDADEFHENAGKDPRKSRQAH